LVDRLSHRTAQTLAAGTAGGRKFLHTLLFQAGSRLRLAPALLPVTFLALSELVMKAAILFAGRGRNEIGNACGLLHGNAMPAVGQLRLKNRSRIFVGVSFRAKQPHVLLTEREIRAY